MAHNPTERVVILIDMDCFYCQVEEQLDSNLKGKPIAVVQYNAWRGGGIIAVNYPARDKGVTRHMRGNDAKEMCPDIVLCRVPQIRGKADLSKYREAGKKVADVLQMFTTILERASVDEAYLDITDDVNKKISEDFKIDIRNMQNTHVAGYKSVQEFIETANQNRDYDESDLKLAIGGYIVEEIRREVLKRTGYKCSAGIAHNKILAKLACGLHKPNQQTILPHNSVPTVYEKLPIKKIKSLGGKFGEQLAEDLNISSMGELQKFTEKDLLKRFDEKTANWLHNIARGIDMEPVTSKLISKSIGCCKKFPGKSALTTQQDLDHWLNELAEEIAERLQQDMEENNRKAKQMVVSFAQEIHGKDISGSRTRPLASYQQVKITQTAIDIIKKNCAKPDGSYAVKFLGISIGNFEDLKNVREITSFFKNMGPKSFDDNMKMENNFNTPVASVFKQNESAMKRDDSDTDSLSSSVYSKSTQEDGNEYQNLVYYDDVYGSGEGCFSKSNSYSTNSIGKEINIESIEDNSNQCIVLDNGVQSSFFDKYFNENSNDCVNNRDFNTSKIFYDDTNMVDSKDDSSRKEPIDQISSLIENTKVNNTNFSEVTALNTIEGHANFKQTCTECNKQIPIDEFQSHIDYHYAIKMVKEEAHLYRPAPQNIIKNDDSGKKFKSSSPKKCFKRKSSDYPGIRLFLDKTKADVDTSRELCSECGKSLDFEDIQSHMDYHVAKKLHLEINSRSTSPIKKNGKLPVDSNKKHFNKSGTSKFQSINTFFKPL